MAPLKLNPMISEMEVSNMKSRGEKVNGALCVPRAVGQPDFAPPPEAIQATQEAAVKGLTSYTAVTGTLELRQALSFVLMIELFLVLKALSFVLMIELFLVLKAVAEYLEKYKKVKYSPDEVLIACGGKQAIYQVVMALCQKGDEVIVPAPYWTSYPDIVKLSGATPVILETTAAQGYAIDAKRLDAAITPRTRLVIDMWERTLTINGFSKAFSMTGYISGKVAELEKKRDTALDLLAKIPADDRVLVKKLRYRVALVPGDAFGDGKCLRLSYAATVENITDAITKLPGLTDLRAGQLPPILAKREESSYQLKGVQWASDFARAALRAFTQNPGFQSDEANAKEGPLKENRLNIAGSKAYVARHSELLKGGGRPLLSRII
ncbi:Bifunctional aspartate aminotransferase and glutamate/aspartate-prephenate aminotransferase [Symbiodinium microadriaticum]|uniref:Bifunctional aspartate aminotransferase and glutamate/aspartate-prephenate aminotransferase n=1 Tax=Symbiodinium microadriaticum TaxID=2951 RepID=A0A1Q9D2E2_SYMMI|nr:Bifunctional aspartate aminotransferase and glutamate/aspartate-prephenate aminotransferase [Symbiodinium microadriaticum]